MTVDDETDRGAATALAAVLSLALLGVLWFGVALGSALIHRHRAEGAADLAALAAATYGTHGPDVACRAAEWVADGMDVVVVRCRLHGGNARVEVRAAPPKSSPCSLVPMHVHARDRSKPVHHLDVSAPLSLEWTLVAAERPVVDEGVYSSDADDVDWRCRREYRNSTAWSGSEWSHLTYRCLASITDKEAK